MATPIRVLVDKDDPRIIVVEDHQMNTFRYFVKEPGMTPMYGFVCVVNDYERMPWQVKLFVPLPSGMPQLLEVIDTREQIQGLSDRDSYSGL